MDTNSENQSPNNEEEKSDNLFGVWKDFKVIMTGILEIRSDTDKKGTIQDVKDNISMKGHTAWVLVFSILIASIGLNTSSAAVVIGAMLISPLMGPILGVGLSIGINDIDTLRRSFVNLGVMIGLSVATSFIFFSIPLFQDLTPEIKARTAPDVRDVFIAIAGGLALIMAMSRRSKQTNTIAGVAIATALMPPLCTAGYGLAVWDLDFFIGAMFLFTINAIFIALATFSTVKFLRFPMVKYINSAKRRRVSQVASVVALLIFGFSVFEFFKLYQVEQFETNAHHLIEDIKSSGIHIFEVNDESINYREKSIFLIQYGNALSNEEMAMWKAKLEDYNLTGTDLQISASTGSEIQNKVEELTDLYARNQEIISSRDEKIEESEDKISFLEKELRKYNKVPFVQISREVKLFESGIESISYSNRIYTDFESIDTLDVFTITWNNSVRKKNRDKVRIKSWLKTRLKLDTLNVVSN